jgi:zinc resistance-associated protein
MWKTIAVAVTALAIAGGSMVYAQQRDNAAAGNKHWRASAQDRGAFADARIAALKAGLKLTPEQEKNWPALEKALRDNAAQRSERFAARASADKPRDPVERLRLHAEVMTQNGAALKQVADAAAPLYQSLDEAQKHRFTILARLDERMGQRHHERHHHRGAGHEMMRHGNHGPTGTEDATKPQ